MVFMNNSTFYKEWLKIRYYVLGAFVFNVLFFVYLFFDIREPFINDPPIMAWNSAIHIHTLFYAKVKYLLLATGIVISLAQFIPEITKNRLRLSLHLPVRADFLILSYISIGLFAIIAIGIVDTTLLYAIVKKFYPHEVSCSALLTALPWFFSGLIAYLATMQVIIETSWKRRIFYSVIFCGFIGLFFMSNEYNGYVHVIGKLFLISLLFIPAVFLPVYRFKSGGERMAARLSRYAVIIISICIMAVYIPHFYWKVFGAFKWRTLLFYSPTLKKFVYKEVVAPHRFQYGDETGKIYNEKELEEILPFLYWRNLEKKGKIPIIIDGKTYDKDTIKKNRQCFELMPKMFPDKHPQIQLYPLFDTKKDEALLKFPKEMFRITDKQMEFITASTNMIDEHLSKVFTNALINKGFVFPARLIAGKPTCMKPFDEGYFIVDSKNSVFHLRRVDNRPFCIKTPIPENIGIRYIKISENKRREFYGILLTDSGEVYLISYDNYRLVPLPLKNYNPDTMDLKILIDPIYRTITYSDENIVYAVVTDDHYRPIARYHRNIPSLNKALVETAYSVLFPFSIQPEPDVRLSRYMSFNVVTNGWPGLIGILASVLFYIFYMRIKKYDVKANLFDLVIILFTGLYGLTAAVVIKPEP